MLRLTPRTLASLVELATRPGSSSSWSLSPSPSEGSAQLLGDDLDHRPGAAILGRPGALPEPAHNHDPAALRERWAACSAWSRQTMTVKNDASCSRRPLTATRNMARAIPASV